MMNRQALHDRLASIAQVFDANHLDEKGVATLLAEVVQIEELLREIPTEQPKSPVPKKEKSDYLTSDQILKIFADEKRARDQATIRAERTIDLEAWVEAAKRDVAELEEQGTEDWFTDMRRGELSLAEKELRRRQRLEAPPDMSSVDQIDWQDLIVRVKEKARLVDLFEGYGVEMRKAGKLWKGCCPWHDDTTPSLVVRTIGQIDYYRCYGCGAHGDVISFVEQTRQLRFLEAVKWLAEEYFLT